MKTGILLNGVDVAIYGLIIATPTGWLDAPSFTRQTLIVPERAGATEVADPQEQPRKITLQGVVQGATAALARSQLDALKRVLGSGPVTLTFPDEPTRFLTAELDTLSLVGTSSAVFIDATISVTIALTALDPYRYDITPSTVAGGAPILLGSAPVRPVLTVTSPGGSPTFTLHDSSGTTVGTLVFAALPAGTTLVVDCQAMTATLDGVSVIGKIASGDFFDVTPALADYVTPAWPTITTSAGSLSIGYRRAWR